MIRKSYADHLREERRLNILLMLVGAPAYRSSLGTLYAQLDAMGDPATRDDVRTDCAWLTEQGLLVSEEPAPGAILVNLTERGLDVSQGKAVVPGVKRAGLR